MPFLGFEISQRRYKKRPDGTRHIDIKSRPVAFASHGDAAIFSYYAHQLSGAYEQIVGEHGISECVIAYRRFIPPKCNIHFAHDAFAEIERRRTCDAVALDIEQFFETIPHGTLKRLWCHLLGVTTLPPDHFAVFKAITRWVKADRDRVLAALNISRSLAENWDGRKPLCTPQQFRDVIRRSKLIERGYRTSYDGTRGIPQGSPISAFLSNLVMLDADIAIAHAARERGVYYRRYSDDVLLIGDSLEVGAIESVFYGEMSKLGFSLNASKTKRSRFTPNPNGLLSASEPFQYLGFTFDGRQVLVRPQTIAKFIQRTKRGVRSAERAATAAARRGGSRRLRREELFARYSHLGPTARLLRSESKSNLRSNFYTYARRSAMEMNRTEIKRQLRKHWGRLNAAIRLADESE